MAVIDEERGVLVIRIVYDGPALSGKTSSLRALARGVSSRVTTPDEVGGRTLFFDWVDYVGGLFDGRQIRCQIVSVPGQLDLARRRRFLTESADALVIVLDTREHEWAFSLDWVKRTVPACRAEDPPIGLILQANKRDAPDAVAEERVRRELSAIAPIAVVPSSATQGEGIREAFVLAVRMALDRVRALSTSGRLTSGKMSEDGPSELLTRLQQLDAQQTHDPAPEMRAAFAQALAAELAPEKSPSKPPASKPPSSTRDEAPSEALFVPDPMLPGGMIWPPVDGRALLHEVASLEIRPTRTSRSDWCASSSGFRFHSASNAVYGDLPSARNELIEWARIHSANMAHVSGGRAVILADAGSGRLRLWQIVRAEATLRERLASVLPLPDALKVADELIDVAQQLAAAREHFSGTTVPLPCSLWTIGAHRSARPTFVGLMPTRDFQLAPEPTGRELLQRELTPHLRELRRSRVDYGAVVAKIVAVAELSPPGTPPRWLAELTEAA